MGWERRQRGGRYYTRSKKVNGRVVREYIGTGPFAELVAHRDVHDRAQRAADSAAWSTERARIETIDAPLIAFWQAVDHLGRSALIAAGYHQHHRGEWRRKRSRVAAGGAIVVSQTLDEGNSVDRQRTAEEMRTLFQRVAEGDQAAVTTMRERFNQAPVMWEIIGDLALQAERSLITAVGQQDVLIKEALERKLHDLKRELAGAAPTPLEKLLVDRIAVGWLHLAYVEGIYAQNLKSFTMAQSEFHQRRIDRAQKRYLAAIKALAQVRRLVTPTVQVNIAEQQVNIAQ